MTPEQERTPMQGLADWLRGMAAANLSYLAPHDRAALRAWATEVEQARAQMAQAAPSPCPFCQGGVDGDVDGRGAVVDVECGVCKGTGQAAQPAEAWKCFHCGETFTDEDAAREHFGTSERQDPACTISIAEYRRMEEAHRRQCAEDTEWHRAYYRLGSEHVQKLRQHGDAEYARGLRDGVNLPADSPERAALAAQAAQTTTGNILKDAYAAMVDKKQAAQEPADERAAAYDKIDRHLRNNLGDADYAEYSVALETLWAREQQRPIVAWRIQLKREPNLGWSLHQKEPPIEAQTHFRIEELVVKSGEPRRPMTEDEICQLAAAAGIETEFWNMGAASLVHYHDVQGIPRAEFTAFARLVERRCGITGEPTPLQKLADLSKEMGEGL